MLTFPEVPFAIDAFAPVYVQDLIKYLPSYKLDFNNDPLISPIFTYFMFKLKLSKVICNGCAS